MGGADRQWVSAQPRPGGFRILRPVLFCSKTVRFVASMARSLRKSISVRGPTYQRLKALCERKGVPLTRYCNDLINKKLDEEGFQSFAEKPLKLWEHGNLLVAARDAVEASAYVSNLLSRKVEEAQVQLSKLPHNPKNLIPGIVVPDEKRSALTG